MTGSSKSGWAVRRAALQALGRGWRSRCLASSSRGGRLCLAKLRGGFECGVSHRCATQGLALCGVD